MYELFLDDGTIINFLSSQQSNVSLAACLMIYIQIFMFLEFDAIIIQHVIFLCNIYHAETVKLKPSLFCSYFPSIC